MTPLLRSLVVAAIAIAPASVHAQLIPTAPNAAPRPTRAYYGGSLVLGQTVGEFHDFVDKSFGLSGNLIYNLDRRGILGIRLDGGFMNYGNERKRVPLSSTIGGRIMVDVNTANNIIHLGLGPQLTVPSGPVRPYVTGSVGMSYFVTESSVEGTRNNNEPFASTNNYDDLTIAYTGAGGILIPIAPRSRTPIAIDIGVRYHRNGEVEYLRKGSIQDNDDSTITITPIRSEANLVSYHLGIQVGIR